MMSDNPGSEDTAGSMEAVVLSTVFVEIPIFPFVKAHSR